jgi:hypothetical protein
MNTKQNSPRSLSAGHRHMKHVICVLFSALVPVIALVETASMQGGQGDLFVASTGLHANGNPTIEVFNDGVPAD